MTLPVIILLISATLKIEIRVIIQAFETHSSPGFHVNSAVLQTIVSRHADAQYAIDFDSFVGCLIKLEMLFSKCRHTCTSIVSVCFNISVSCPEMFKSLEKDGSGTIELDLQQVCQGTKKVASSVSMLC